MRVLIATTECQPFASTGILGETIPLLATALYNEGVDVRIIIPRYRRISTEGLADILGGLPVQVSSKTVYGRIYEGKLLDKIPVYFVDQPEYFDRSELYVENLKNYSDNAERFIFFSRAVVEFVSKDIFKPDILQCNDWFTGLSPVYLKTLYSDTIQKVKSVMTIHNIEYQGLFWHYDMHLTCLPWSLFTFDKLEFHGKLNLLKGGIVHADAVTTISESYAEEILTKEKGCGLDETLRLLGNRFAGIPTLPSDLQKNPSDVAKRYIKLFTKLLND